jgi:hypothetical protein
MNRRGTKAICSDWGDLAVKAKETIDEALDRVVPATKVVLQKLCDMDEKPDAIDVTFVVLS